VLPLSQCKSNNYYTFWVCIFSLRYPTSNAQVLYYPVTCGLPGCTIFFFTLSHKQYYFRKKKITYHKCVFWFLHNFFFSETHRTLRRTERDMIKTATSLWTSLHLWHLAAHHCKSFVIPTKVNKPSKIFETSRPPYSTNTTTPATHSDVTPLTICICKNLAERKAGHRCWFTRLLLAPSMGQAWNR